MSRITADPPRTDEGVEYMTLLPGKAGRKMCVTGIKFDAADNDQTDNDKSFAETREIQGAWLEVENHQPGDYVELFVVMPANPPDVPDEVIVGQFGETVYIPPSKKVEQIVSEGTVSFPAGFKIRMRYHAASGGTTRTVYAWYRLRK
jgi:hypothetical protein